VVQLRPRAVSRLGVPERAELPQPAGHVARERLRCRRVESAEIDHPPPLNRDGSLSQRILTVRLGGVHWA
jgi:hypothetical protein